MLALWISLALISLVSGQVCNPYTNRVDCGYVGITEGQCQSKGCCWYPTDNVPWCFFKSGGQPSCKPDALRNDCDMPKEEAFEDLVSDFQHLRLKKNDYE
ncbi:hypothetical protein EMCRGX_G014169 [Ephydatia muelleri]